MTACVASGEDPLSPFGGAGERQVHVVQLDQSTRQQAWLRSPTNLLHATFDQSTPAVAQLADDVCLDLRTAMPLLPLPDRKPGNLGLPVTATPSPRF